MWERIKSPSPAIFINYVMPKRKGKKKKEALRPAPPIPWLSSAQLMNLTEQIHKKAEIPSVRPKLEICLMLSCPPLKNTHMTQSLKTDHGTKPFPLPMSKQSGIHDTDQLSLDLVGFSVYLVAASSIEWFLSRSMWIH